MDAVFYTNFKNCDLAVEGSPSNKTFISPLKTVLSGKNFLEPPKSMQAIAFLIYSLP
jgi:hypothetical protein